MFDFVLGKLGGTTPGVVEVSPRTGWRIRSPPRTDDDYSGKEGARTTFSPGPVKLALLRIALSPEEGMMITVRKKVVALYVDRSSGQWIARDPDGGLWLLPVSDNPWDDRRPFFPAEETDLESVPGHYLYQLGIPF